MLLVTIILIIIIIIIISCIQFLMIFTVLRLIKPDFISFSYSFMQFCVSLWPPTDLKTMRKKGLIKKRFLNFRHFGRFWTPNSDLSDGQIGAICETFWRLSHQKHRV